MKTRILNSVVLVALIVGAFSCTTPARVEEGKMKSKPNILFIAVDDLRPELSFYGAKHIKSPNLDKLASQSLIFNRSYCNVPVCGASRASLLTGTRPTRNRFIGFNTWKDKDFPEVESLPMTFKKAGYTTLSRGKVYHNKKDDTLAWHEVWRPSMSSRDYKTNENKALDALEGMRGKPYESANVPDTAYYDGIIADKAISDLKNFRKSGDPFFLAVGFSKPHLPFVAPTKYWDMYDANTISLPESYVQPETTPLVAFHNSGELRHYAGVPEKGHVAEEEAKKLIHGYYACVSFVDAQIGRVIDELNASGLAENTIIVLWGDHGWNLGDHMLWCKHCNFETSLRTPLLVKVPKVTKGKTTDSIVEFIDIYPSLCELAGIDLPDHLKGESFVSLMDGGKRKKDYAISKYHDSITLVKGDYFYTEWTDNEGVAKNRMLFNQATDPMELDNLAEKPEFQAIAKQMATELHQNWGKDFFKN